MANKIKDGVAININSLLKGKDKSNLHETYIYTMKSGDQVNVEFTFKGWERHILVNHYGEGKPLQYYIEIDSVFLHNGGTSYYLRCPVTNNLAKILYLMEGAEKFSSAGAYRSNGSRIYYATQLLNGKLDRTEYSIKKLEHDISKQEQSLYKSHYRGNPTKPIQRLSSLHKRYVDKVNQLGANLKVSFVPGNLGIAG